LAGRKRVYRLYPLDFEEFLIWKEGLNLESVSNFLINPINKKLVLSYLEEFLIW
jgi:predicted AAA+ superfamily ATPase